MSDAIRVSLEPPEVRILGNGDSVEMVITIQNTGPTPEQYHVEVDGLPPQWCKVYYVAAVLPPQHRDQARLVIKPPAGTHADIYQFTVSVVSIADNDERTRAQAVLQVGSSTAIAVTMEINQVRISEDGTPQDLMIIIRNTGQITDRYTITVDNLPPEWYRLSRTEVDGFMPNQQSEITLTLCPSIRGGATAGLHPFTITVRSRVDLTQTGRAHGLLQVPELAAHELTLNPLKRIGRTGRYAVTVANTGNTDLSVELNAGDTQAGCTYTLTPKAFSLLSGGWAEAQLLVASRQYRVAGSRKNYNFQVKSTPSHGQSKAIQGEFEYQPVVNLAIARIVLPIVVAVLALLIFAVKPVRDGIQDAICQNVHVLCRPSPYQFVQRFAIFHNADPQIVGQPSENEYQAKVRLAMQKTSTGLLVYDRDSGRAFLIPQGTTIYQYDHGETTLLTGPHLLLGHTLPTDPALALSGTGHQYIANTRHNLDEPFLSFWNQHGGAAVLGDLETESFCEHGTQPPAAPVRGARDRCASGWSLVQYTARFRLELAGDQVAPAPLWNQLADGSAAAFSPIKACASSLDQYDKVSEHCITQPFLTYLTSHSDMAALLGHPVSEQTQQDTQESSGRIIAVQWFQNGRLEFHPELAAMNLERVVVAPTGKEDLFRIGWIPVL